jgi:hypothetical protein
MFMVRAPSDGVEPPWSRLARNTPFYKKPGPV